MTQPQPSETPEGSAPERFGDEAITLGLLRGDPLYRYIVPGSAQTLLDFALAEGRSRAAWLQTVYGPGVREIAARLEVPIRAVDTEGGWAQTIVFAQYESNPPAITLYRPAIERLKRLVKQAGMQVWLASADLQAIFIAHELYHHLDSSSMATPLSERHQVELLRVGPWCWRGGLSSLDEIAAGAFAQALLGLPRHPRILDMLCIYEADTESITSIAHDLRHGAEVVGAME